MGLGVGITCELFIKSAQACCVLDFTAIKHQVWPMGFGEYPTRDKTKEEVTDRQIRELAKNYQYLWRKRKRAIKTGNREQRDKKDNKNNIKTRKYRITNMQVTLARLQEHNLLCDNKVDIFNASMFVVVQKKKTSYVIKQHSALCMHECLSLSLLLDGKIYKHIVNGGNSLVLELQHYSI